MENSKLEVLVQESGLEESKAEKMLDAFHNYFKIAGEWEIKAKGIVVTSEEQVVEMKMARVGRLFLREKRIKIEKMRKSLKEQSVREGKAIDGISNVLKGLIVPIEEYLMIQEKYAERQAAERAEKKRVEEEAEERRKEEAEEAAREEKEKAEREKEALAKKEESKKKREREEREAAAQEKVNADLEAENRRLKSKIAGEIKERGDGMKRVEGSGEIGVEGEEGARVGTRIECPLCHGVFQYQGEEAT